MKISLIQPAMGRERGAFVESWKMEPLSIATLASLTPRRHEIAFHDDRVEEIPYGEKTDLVAITAETYTARRAYQIARRYRERGVPVVMGGYHATLVPEEVQGHADATVTGEAETVWARILDDAEHGTLKRVYRGKRSPLAGVRPHREIFAGKKYMPLTLVESGRGCRFGCDFCSISAYFEKSYRYRPPREVAAEIEAAGKKTLFLVDDNLTADPERAKDLFREIAPLKVRWMSQATIGIAKDPELLRLMEQSGCSVILVGFESLSEETLRMMNKRFNRGADNFSESLEKLRDHGIKIYATFVFGYDTDTPDVYERTLEFAMNQKFFVAAFNHLQPFPGTPLYRRMEAEGRLLYPKWWLEPSYRFGTIAFRPKGMEPEALYKRLMGLRKEFYSVPGILERAGDLKANLKNPDSAWQYLFVNAILRKELKEKWATPLGDRSDDLPPGLEVAESGRSSRRGRTADGACVKS